LDTTMPIHTTISRLERRISHVFRLEITSGQEKPLP
jgi:alpha-D-ribose 1-methylphosphonate 5-triphosphate synthase subunit PhnI